VVLADGLSWAGQTSAGKKTKNVRVGAITFNEMPRRNEAYSSLGAVIVKLDNALPDAASLASLLAWARLGGSLVLVGPRAETLAASTPGIREWLEPRFVLERDAISLSALLGLGRLHVLNTELDMGSLSTSSAIVPWLRVAKGSTPQLSSGAAQPFDPGPAVKPTIPMRPLVAGLVGFVILVGPVNFIRAKRRGKSITLLVTIPLFSVAAFVALIAFGLWHQGLDTKVKSHSYALLDQRTHVSSSVENRTVYAGWIGGSGLRPGAGTSVIPLIHPVRTNTSVFGRPTAPISDAFRIAYDGETRLTGEFLPPRRSVAQSILTDRPTRLRLSIERKGPELRVNNGLGASVRRLWIFDTRGTCHALRQTAPLEIGATASLTEAANPDLDRHYNRVWHASGIVPCTFAAILSENPFGDACGVKTTETAGYHYVVGILDEKEENWK
jgi:hypothetical protein